MFGASRLRTVFDGTAAHENEFSAHFSEGERQGDHLEVPRQIV
jgi:hypothetical protein